MKTIKCGMCKKIVKDKRITKHMWADHRAHMMKNHKGGFGKKVSPTETAKQHQKLVEALKPPRAADRIGGFLDRASESSSSHLRSTYVANGKKLTVVVHQGKNQIEISNVTLVEVLE